MHGAVDGAEGLSRFFRDLAARASTDRRGCLMVNLMADEAPSDPELTSRTAAHRAGVRAALRAAVTHAAPSASGETVDRRTELLLVAALGLNLAARTAPPDELGTIIAGIDAEVASWA